MKSLSSSRVHLGGHAARLVRLVFDNERRSYHTRLVLVALVTIGALLILFGGLVLVKFPERPGGQIEFHGVMLDSRGAGLPLIVLGLAAVVIAALAGPSQSEPTAATQSAGSTGQQEVTTAPPTTTAAETTTAETTTTTTTAAAGSTVPSPAASCIGEHLDKEPAVSEHLWTRLPEGQTAQLMGGSSAAVILMRNTEITGAVRLQYRPIGDPALTVIDVVDGSCRLGAASVREVRNGFAVTVTLPDRQYQLGIDYGSDLASRALPKITLAPGT
jgi:hypothetical protein